MPQQFRRLHMKPPIVSTERREFSVRVPERVQYYIVSSFAFHIHDKFAGARGRVPVPKCEAVLDVEIGVGASLY